MDAFDFITGCDANDLFGVLSKAKCRSCDGSGECNDAEPGDISFKSWTCTDCDGKGWDKQAVREIIAAVETCI